MHNFLLFFTQKNFVKTKKNLWFFTLCKNFVKEKNGLNLPSRSVEKREIISPKNICWINSLVKLLLSRKFYPKSFMKIREEWESNLLLFFYKTFIKILKLYEYIQSSTYFLYFGSESLRPELSVVRASARGQKFFFYFFQKFQLYSAFYWEN